MVCVIDGKTGNLVYVTGDTVGTQAVWFVLQDRLAGLVVKASTSGAEDAGFKSHWVNSYQ